MQRHKALVIGGAVAILGVAAVSAAYQTDAPNVYTAKELRGMNIVNQKDQNLGEVKEVVVDFDSSGVVYVVISSPDAFGRRDRMGAVPPTAFQRSADGRSLVLNVDQETLSTAPSFVSTNWPKLSDRVWANRVYSHYGSMPQPTGRAIKVSDLFGTRVDNQQSERLGDIQDLVLDLSAARIMYAVLGTARTLGLGERSLAIPSGALTASTDQKRLVLDIDKDRLTTAPGFDQRSWQSTLDPTQTEEIYSYYGQQPYWDTGRSPRFPGVEAAILDRGSSVPDNAVVQRIRLRFSTDTTLSTEAKNVQILTDYGKVTLRGTVNSEEARTQLEATAKQAAGVAALDNQIEVQK